MTFPHHMRRRRTPVTAEQQANGLLRKFDPTQALQAADTMLARAGEGSDMHRYWMSVRDILRRWGREENAP